jgi:branched-chain amino acid transport system ATP-binding protein
MSDYAMSLRHVSKDYQGVKAVSDVSIVVRHGERLAVIGPNGAGKSTVFGMMAGEHRPTAGTVHFDDHDVTRWTPSRRARAGISRTFQVARLFDSMTVRENLFMAAFSTRRRPRMWDAMAGHRKARATADELLEQAELTADADATAATLGQGGRKTLEMAMAIAQRPRLLLLDEPTAGMSLEDAQAAVVQLNALLDARPELTIVLTAHDMDVVNRLAGRVVLMARGQVVLEGTPTEVSAHATTRELYLGGTS